VTPEHQPESTRTTGNQNDSSVEVVPLRLT
jgi:hypothetical protein